MKKTALKRKTPLKSKTPLKAKQGLKRTGFKSKRQKPIKQTGFKSKKQKPMKHSSDPWRDKADRLWQRVIHIIFGYRCARCDKYLKGPEGELLGEGHHMVRRDVYHLRHDPDNGVLGCPDCHRLAPDSWERDPKGFEEWLQDNLPKYWEWLEAHRWEEGKKPDYKEKCQFLDTLIKELEGR